MSKTNKYSKIWILALLWVILWVWNVYWEETKEFIFNWVYPSWHQNEWELYQGEANIQSTLTDTNSNSCSHEEVKDIANWQYSVFFPNSSCSESFVSWETYTVKSIIDINWDWTYDESDIVSETSFEYEKYMNKDETETTYVKKEDIYNQATGKILDSLLPYVKGQIVGKNGSRADCESDVATCNSSYYDITNLTPDNVKQWVTYWYDLVWTMQDAVAIHSVIANSLFNGICGISPNIVCYKDDANWDWIQDFILHDKWTYTVKWFIYDKVTMSYLLKDTKNYTSWYSIYPSYPPIISKESFFPIWKNWTSQWQLILWLYIRDKWGYPVVREVVKTFTMNGLWIISIYDNKWNYFISNNVDLSYFFNSSMAGSWIKIKSTIDWNYFTWVEWQINNWNDKMISFWTWGVISQSFNTFWYQDVLSNYLKFYDRGVINSLPNNYSIVLQQARNYVKVNWYQFTNWNVIFKDLWTYSCPWTNTIGYSDISFVSWLYKVWFWCWIWTAYNYYSYTITL